ncbi:type II toxin-antitoxin system prevent-host-death family antitoxin [Chelativorans sp. ZYF759]|uniref:type II toxin-antitoxin system Phd/YefM family antitoxin n=1 Tax=Chelativorans sp. ZYF759 TaxID=2692213 RepID=UPI00145DD286|nr:type II toxin-antitoxin system prevent-host-death family antitoxin [Chelativorans sp. ZYF759]NMG39532.1 type II toxin-antitoxin system prevent-host-death family antitoxin [Chelativorans sp. ZYF759]
MREIGLFEAKNRLSELVGKAEKGEEIVITRRGKPAARLVALRNDDDKRHQALEAVARIRELRKGLTLGGLDIKELINEGRR